MRKAEMSPAQLDERHSFIHMMQAAAWDFSGWEELFEQGARLTPEAQAEYDNPFYHLRLGWWAAEHYISLEMLAPDGAALAFRFYPRDHLYPLVDRIVLVQDTLSPDSYVELIGALLPLCTSVAMETPEGVFRVS